MTELYEILELTQTEEDFVLKIRQYLLTGEQKKFLSNHDITIEDCLNGRLANVDDNTLEELREMFHDWNVKCGKKLFFEEML